MLFARRQRQHKAAPPGRIHRFATQPSGHLADIFFLAPEQPDIRPAELQANADRLPLTHHDVGVHLAGRFDCAERYRLGHHRDQQRLVRMAGIRQRRQVG